MNVIVAVVVAMIEVKKSAAEALADSYERWAVQVGVQQYLAANFKTVATWVETCAPPGATEEQKLLACIDIGVWFFYLDDHPPLGYRTLARKMNAILRGWYLATEPLIGPGCNYVLERMTDWVRGSTGPVADRRERDPSLARYLADRRRVVRELGRRKRSESTRIHPMYSAHLAQRENTIFIDQWMSLWEILGSCVLPDRIRYSSFVVEAALLVKRWHVFANEVRSIERDLRTGTPNLVLLYKREKRVELDVATGYVAGHARGCRERFIHDFVPKFRSFPEPSVREWGEILIACMFGGDRNYQENKVRYESFGEA